jgi:hypothetical protein
MREERRSLIGLFSIPRLPIDWGKADIFGEPNTVGFSPIRDPDSQHPSMKKACLEELSCFLHTKSASSIDPADGEQLSFVSFYFSCIVLYEAYLGSRNLSSIVVVYFWRSPIYLYGHAHLGIACMCSLHYPASLPLVASNLSARRRIQVRSPLSLHLVEKPVCALVLFVRVAHVAWQMTYTSSIKAQEISS